MQAHHTPTNPADMNYEQSRKNATDVERRESNYSKDCPIENLKNFNECSI